MANSISHNTTLRELMSIVPDTSNAKLPTAKALRTGTEAILYDSCSEGFRIIVYANGFYIYSASGHCTVQSVHKCKESILYEYADGNKSLCNAEMFLDQPFLIRLVFEGDTRLEANQTARQSAHTYSYDNLPQESTDLVDPINIEESVVAKLDQEQLHVSLSQLTNKQRQAVELHHLCGLTQAETAKRIGTTREAVKARLQGALRSMEQLLRNTMQ